MIARLLLWTAVTLIGLEVSAPAAAQVQKTLVDSPIPFSYSRGRNVSVLERGRPEYQPIGILVESFTLSPKLDLGVNYTDNVYQTTTKVDDVYFTIAPAVAANSNWSRHAIGLTASGLFRRYAKQSARNEDGWNVGATGRLDIGTQSSLNLSASTARLYESQFSGSAITGFASPIPYQRTLAAARATYVGGRLKVTGVGDFARYNFLPATTFAGTVVSQDNRDREIYRGAGQIEYGLSPDTGLFVSVNYARTKYRLPLTALVPNRDSDTVQVLGGVSFDLTALLRGSVGIGYTQRKFDSPIYQNIGGVSFGAQIEYFPSQLTTITLAARRVTEDSTLLGSGGYYNNGGSARVDHELRRNVLLHATADYEVDTYRGIVSEARIFRASAGGTYLLNRRISVDADYSHGERRSSGVLNGPVFSENRGLLTLSFHI